MKKGILMGLAAVAVGVVIYTMNKKDKSLFPVVPPKKDKK